MGSYRCLATWPYMAEMHPAKRSTTTLPTPQPSTPELPRPVADVPGCFDDDGDDNVMDLWKSRHDMPGGMMEALERINLKLCLLYTSPSPRDATLSRMPSSA